MLREPVAVVAAFVAVAGKGDDAASGNSPGNFFPPGVWDGGRGVRSTILPAQFFSRVAESCGDAEHNATSGAASKC